VGYDLTPQGVNPYLKSLSCRNAKLRFYQSLKILFRWLLRDDYIPDNAMEKVSPPKTQKRLLAAISEGQLRVYSITPLRSGTRQSSTFCGTQG
jgi:site-specific recombinase XerD